MQLANLLAKFFLFENSNENLLAKNDQNKFEGKKFGLRIVSLARVFDKTQMSKLEGGDNLEVWHGSQGPLALVSGPSGHQGGGSHFCLVEGIRPPPPGEYAD